MFIFVRQGIWHFVELCPSIASDLGGGGGEGGGREGGSKGLN